MAQTFACPNCTASLDYDGGNHLTQKCPYCNSTVIIPENLRPRAHQQDFAPLLAKQQGVQRVVHLLNHDQMEEAIQLYMDTFGVDLNQAADAVERLAAGLSFASQHVTTIHLKPQGTR